MTKQSHCPLVAIPIQQHQTPYKQITPKSFKPEVDVFLNHLNALKLIVGTYLLNYPRKGDVVDSYSVIVVYRCNSIIGEHLYALLVSILLNVHRRVSQLLYSCCCYQVIIVIVISIDTHIKY